MFSKFFDNKGPLSHHIHHGYRIAAHAGEAGKPKMYSYGDINMFNENEQQRREETLSAVYERKTNASAAVAFYFNQPYSYKETLTDFEKMENGSRLIIDEMYKSGGDNPMFVNTFCSIGMVAEAFGCEIEIPEEKMPWVHRVVKTEDVYSIVPKKISQLAYYKRQREWVDYAQRKIGVDLPYWSLDIQSPFSVAAQVLGTEELLIACYDDPAAVHHLLRMITDVTIDLHDDHMRQMEHPGYPGRNFPSISKNIGICIADDTPLIMLSGDMYREFALPYNSELGRHYGGVHIHSCGAYMNNMDRVLEIENVRSVQLHAGPGEYVLPEKAGEDCAFVRAMQKAAMFIDTNAISRSDRWAKRPIAFYEEYLLPRLRQNTPKWLMLEAPENEMKLAEQWLSGLYAKK
ncbi:MAG: uroporphyrinogen decarboxylase family protein [Clostridia bacterium]|nr:uroporphyrinogen decarboxylase family protein [Clostridia bacterium]